MTTNNDTHAIDPEAAAEAQAKLTKSVGEPLTRESRDADVPLWKRWLKRDTPSA
ncbi:MAG TPA: hypothetical protein VLK36_05200 [Gaiellaceae bacterium]|nr:hypothetical protein [Gaiellaceae bacterium]